MKADGTRKLKPQRASLCSEPFPTRKLLAAEPPFLFALQSAARLCEALWQQALRGAAPFSALTANSKQSWDDSEVFSLSSHRFKINLF